MALEPCYFLYACGLQCCLQMLAPYGHMKQFKKLLMNVINQSFWLKYLKARLH